METAIKPLDVPTAIRQRRSIKNFTRDPIAPEVLRQLIELTVAAPSSWNLQDWRIVLVRSEAQKAALSAAAFNQKQIVEAPVTFVFAASPYSWRDGIEPIIEQGLVNGWSEGFAAYLRGAVPQFQQALGEKTASTPSKMR